MTRAEFVAALARGLGLRAGEGASFADVGANNANRGAIEAAAEYHLIAGFGDGTFRPEERLTREQAVTMLERALQLAGAPVAEPAGDALSDFSDASSVSNWARQSMATAIAAGLVKGRDGDQLDPQAYVTKAETAALIRRLLQYSKLI